MIKSQDKKLLVMILLLIGIAIITISSAYSFFIYNKEGTKVISLESKTVRLHYEENNLKKINLVDALPMNDDRGKAQTDYFEFTITGDTASYEIPYIVALRVSTPDSNRIPPYFITVYLTEVVNNSENEILLTTYDRLVNITKNNFIEQKLIRNTIDADTSNYSKTYRLRVWINELADYSPIEENGTQIYPMLNREFVFTINVYTDDEIVSPTPGRITPGLYTMDDVLIEDWNELLERGLLETNIVNGKSIVDAALEDNNIDLGKLILAETVTSISSGAFYDYSKLGGIVISSSVQSIGSTTFLNNTNLQTVIFEDNSTLQSIDSAAFYGCTSLQSIELPNTVSSIGTSLFENDSNLVSANIPSSLTSLNLNTFANTGLVSITIPKNIKSIEDQAFANCTHLSNITFEDNSTLESIGRAAFVVNNISSITLPNTVTNIGQSAFSACSNLETINLSSSLISIGTQAFTGCNKLSSITFPESVTDIGQFAFASCDNLNNAYFEDQTNWYKNGSSIDVSNSSSNATLLRNGFALLKN